MTIVICEDCNLRIATSRNNTDVICDCSDSSSDALSNEDVPIVNSRTNPDGSTYTDLPGDVKFAGVENRAWGTRGWLNDANVDKRTARGNRKSTHRTRTKFAYIDVNKAKEKR